MLTTECIRGLLDAAIARANELGISVTVAVVDGGGALCGLVRMQDAHSGAVDIAVDKAWTCVSFGGRTTRQLSAQLDGMREVVRAAILQRPRYTPLTGGVPIKVGGLLIGAVGVAGDSPDNDEACAAASLAGAQAEPI